MSITTYAELKTAVANWLNKSNLTATIPDFISLAEADINRRLRVRNLEAVATGSLSANPLDMSSELTRYAKIKSVALTIGGDDVIMNYVSPQQYFANYDDGATGVPEVFTIVGDDMYFGPAPDSSYAYTIWYFSKLQALASASTNWLLTNHPDVYLYGALYAAEPFLKNDQRIMIWKSMYEQCIEAVRQESINDKPGGTMKQRTEMGVI